MKTPKVHLTNISVHFLLSTYSGKENMLFMNEKTKVTIDELKEFNTSWLREYMSN